MGQIWGLLKKLLFLSFPSAGNKTRCRRGEHTKDWNGSPQSPSPQFSSALINNRYDWLAGSLLLLLNVKASCSWPLHPPMQHFTTTCTADAPAFHQTLFNRSQPRDQHVNSASFETLTLSMPDRPCVTTVCVFAKRWLLMLPAGPEVKMCQDELFEKAAEEANKCRRGDISPRMSLILLLAQRWLRSERSVVLCSVISWYNNLFCRCKSIHLY